MILTLIFLFTIIIIGVIYGLTEESKFWDFTRSKTEFTFFNKSVPYKIIQYRAGYNNNIINIYNYTTGALIIRKKIYDSDDNASEIAKLIDSSQGFVFYNTPDDIKNMFMTK